MSAVKEEPEQGERVKLNADGLPQSGEESHAEVHAWKPISRSFLRATPLENSGCTPSRHPTRQFAADGAVHRVYLLSELPMPILHMEFDWALKKKNVRQVAFEGLPACFGTRGKEGRR